MVHAVQTRAVFHGQVDVQERAVDACTWSAARQALLEADARQARCSGSPLPNQGQKKKPGAVAPALFLRTRLAGLAGRLTGWSWRCLTGGRQ